MTHVSSQDIADAVRAGREDVARSSAEPVVRERRAQIRELANQDATAQRSEFLRLAVERSPFYRRVVAHGGSSVSLGDFPQLTKSTVRENFADLIARYPGGAVVGDNHVITQTSGSTGIPVSTIQSRQAAFLEYAVLRRMYDSLGLGLGDLWDLGLRTSGEPLLQAEPLLLQGLQWNLPRLRPEDAFASTVYEVLLTEPSPELILGVSSVLVTLAEYCLAENARVRPKAVMASYEYLSPAARDVLQTAFEAPVRLLYGTAETGLCALECEVGNLHFDALVDIEVVSSGGTPTFLGEQGRLLVTSYMTEAMPIIRYDTGDLAARVVCECGVAGQTTSQLQGRDAQPVWGTAWFECSPYPVLAELSKLGLSSFQLVQRRVGELEVLILPGTVASSRVVDHLRQRLPRPMVERLEFSVYECREFVLTESGKRNPMVQLLQRHDSPPWREGQVVS